MEQEYNDKYLKFMDGISNHSPTLVMIQTGARIIARKLTQFLGAALGSPSRKLSTLKPLEVPTHNLSESSIASAQTESCEPELINV